MALFLIFHLTFGVTDVAANHSYFEHCLIISYSRSTFQNGIVPLNVQ